MHKRVWLTLCIALAFISSCKKEQDQDLDSKVFVSCDDLYNMKPQQPALDTSRIIYHDRLNPAPLNEGQLKKICDILTDYNKRTNDVWFIRVLYNNIDYLTTDIYFKPRAASERIVKGEHLYCDASMINSTGNNVHNTFQKIRKESPLPEYIYITAIGQVGMIQRTPSSEMMPFAPPNGLQDEEIVEIVDFIRSRPTINRDETEDLISSYYPEKVESDLPIYSIERTEDGIEVMTGTQEGPLAGSGQLLTIKKTAEGYELISMTLWYS